MYNRNKLPLKYSQTEKKSPKYIKSIAFSRQHFEPDSGLDRALPENIHQYPRDHQSKSSVHKKYGDQRAPKGSSSNQSLRHSNVNLTKSERPHNTSSYIYHQDHKSSIPKNEKEAFHMSHLKLREYHNQFQSPPQKKTYESTVYSPDDPRDLIQKY